MLQSPLKNGRCVSTFRLLPSSFRFHHEWVTTKATSHTFIHSLNRSFDLPISIFGALSMAKKNTFYFFPIIFISMVRCAGEKSIFQMIVLTEEKKPFRFQHDDKNTHFVIASTIAPTDQPFIFPGGMQRTNLQSQSFPDLSRKIDVRSMKGGGNVRPMYKSSKLPVASRWGRERN